MKKGFTTFMKTERGFTLVELLVVISIIAILSVMGMAVYTRVLNNAREAKAKGDLDAFVKAYELKFNVATGKYPEQLTADDFVGGIPVPLGGGDYPDCTGGKTGTCNLLGSTNLDRPFELCIILDSGSVCKKSAQLLVESTGKALNPRDITPTALAGGGGAGGGTSGGGTSPTPTTVAAGGGTVSTSAVGTSPSPTASPTASPTPTPTRTPSPILTAAYIQTNIGCSTPLGLTPDQICQREVSSTSRAVNVSSTIVAKGYWWKQCGGASVSNCNGLDCTVNALDCTNTPGIWGSQQPYPSQYLKFGTNTTVYTPGGPNRQPCAGYAPGWTMRVYCSSSTSPTPTPSPSP